MIEALLIIVLQFLVCVGWGAAADKAISKWIAPSLRQSNIGELCFLGIMSLIAMGMILNFVIPLWPALGVIVVVSGLGMVWLFRASVKASTGENPKLVWLLSLPFLLIVSLWATQAPTHYDYGLYYGQAILWTIQEPIMPGLVNLHVRFGFNVAWFLFLSWFFIPGIELSAIHTSVSFMGFAAYLVFLVGLFGQGPTWRDRPIEKAYALGALISLLASKNLGMTMDAPSPDHAAVLFILLSGYAFIRFIEDFKAGKATIHYSLFLLCLTAATAMFIKISAVFVLLFVVAALAIVFLKSKIDRTIIVSLAIVAAIGVAWLARSILLSGCLVYPASFTCFEALAWTPTNRSIDRLSETITNWGKIGSMTNKLSQEERLVVFSGFNWVEFWAASPARGLLFFDLIKRLTLGCIGCMILAASYMEFSKLNDSIRLAIKEDSFLKISLTTILSVGLALLALGFVMAPDPRFFSGSVILIATAICALIALPITTSQTPYDGYILKAVLAFFLISALLYPGSIGALISPPDREKYFSYTRLNMGKRIPTPEPVVETSDDISINRVSRKTHKSDQCWFAETPCTPFALRNLKKETWLIWDVYYR